MFSISRMAILILALAATGCATTSGPSQYGNYLKDQPISVDQLIANDALKQLAMLYPPAKTRLTIKQPTPDVFGSELVKGLREAGYALQEYSPKAQHEPDTADAGLPLMYVLDQAKDDHLYRLTLQVGDQAINRPYRQEQGTVVPAGYWARKE
ncbi:MAG: conjugal transfer protein TrbH [Sedimenticola sp.]|nr:MAG: conjugal transfer protein TrbH [Sedimenticola sp.]